MVYGKWDLKYPTWIVWTKKEKWNKRQNKERSDRLTLSIVHIPLYMCACACAHCSLVLLCFNSLDFSQKKTSI